MVIFNSNNLKVPINSYFLTKPVMLSLFMTHLTMHLAVITICAETCGLYFLTKLFKKY